MIHCPQCDNPHTRVIDSRWTGSSAVKQDGALRTNDVPQAARLNTIRRRRVCGNDHRFTTYEFCEVEIPNTQSDKYKLAAKKLLVILLKYLTTEESLETAIAECPAAEKDKP